MFSEILEPLSNKLDIYYIYIVFQKTEILEPLSNKLDIYIYIQFIQFIGFYIYIYIQFIEQWF
jgi:hypothetical protein